MTEKPDVCIYHGGCDDGFCAAWAVWEKWGDDVAFIPGIYGEPPPDLTGKKVLMVDFSYKRPVIEQMAKQAYSLTILDHHKTAQADLADLEAWAAMEGIGASVTVVFDMNQSGARLAWDYCFGIAHNDPPPNIVSLIEDRDLWRFAYGDRTKQFSAALRTYPMDFKVWREIAKDPDKLIPEGEIVLKAHQANIQKFTADAFMEEIGGHLVPCCNVPYHYASDTAHELLSQFPKAPFAASWFKRGDGKVQYSLRSEDSRADVSEVAKGLGGGGHRNAAGFQIDI